MKVLVTGGAGFLGSHLCDFLLGKGCEVVCMDNLLTGSLENIAHIQDPRFVFVKYDVTNFISIKGDLAGAIAASSCVSSRRCRRPRSPVSSAGRRAP